MIVGGVTMLDSANSIHLQTAKLLRYVPVAMATFPYQHIITCISGVSGDMCTQCQVHTLK